MRITEDDWPGPSKEITIANPYTSTDAQMPVSTTGAYNGHLFITAREANGDGLNNTTGQICKILRYAGGAFTLDKTLALDLAYIADDRVLAVVAHPMDTMCCTSVTANATTITLPLGSDVSDGQLYVSRENDYYNNWRVIVRDTCAVERLRGVTARIADYDGATGIATLTIAPHDSWPEDVGAGVLPLVLIAPTASVDPLRFIPLTADQVETELQQAPILHPYCGTWPSVEVAIVDNDRILGARQLDHRLGTVTVRNAYDIVEVDNGFFTPGMVGRDIHIQDESEKGRLYRILDWIDATHISIGYLNPQTGVYVPWMGRSGEFNYVIKGRKNRVWWSTKTSELGACPEYVAYKNYLDIDMPGDEIMGLSKVNEYTLVIGKHSVWRMFPDVTAMDDDPYALVYRKPEPISGVPGAISTRSIVSLPNGRVCWLTAAGQVVIASAADFQVVDQSAALNGMFANSDVRDLSKAFAFYMPRFATLQINFVEHGSGPIQTHAEGSFVDEQPLPEDYGPFAALDFSHDALYRGDSQRFCSVLHGESLAADVPELAEKTFAGGADGYIYEVGRDDVFGFGCPSPVLRYTASVIQPNPPAPPANGTVTVDTSPGVLPTDGDGLKGISLVRIQGGVSFRTTILSNTADTITIADVWPTPVQDGAVILLAPIEYSVRFIEQRTKKEAVVKSVSLEQSGVGDLPLNVEVYTAAANALQADVSAPAYAHKANESLLRRVSGEVFLRPMPSKALQVGLRGFVQGKMQIQGVSETVLVSETETGR